MKIFRMRIFEKKCLFLIKLKKTIKSFTKEINYDCVYFI